jgi:predicted lipid-binding transport protein (Tim44 family)
MSGITPRFSGGPSQPVQHRPTTQQQHTHHPIHPEHHLSAAGRTKKILVAPLAGGWAGFKGGLAGTAIAGALITTLAATSHKFLAATVALGSLIAVPVYAIGKALGRFFGNIKAGLTGHSNT